MQFKDNYKNLYVSIVNVNQKKIQSFQERSVKKRKKKNFLFSVKRHSFIAVSSSKVHKVEIKKKFIAATHENLHGSRKKTHKSKRSLGVQSGKELRFSTTICTITSNVV